jgi:hypothetical protein
MQRGAAGYRRLVPDLPVLTMHLFLLVLAERLDGARLAIDQQGVLHI